MRAGRAVRMLRPVRVPDRRGDRDFGTSRIQLRAGGEDVKDILFGLFYVVAITVVILHFTGWLAARNLEWIVYVIAVAVFPVVIFLH